MTNAGRISVPKWFWLITVLATIWYLMDMSSFVMRVFMLDDVLSSMSANQQQLYTTMPSWVNAIFALEVFGGTLGCLGLWIKKKWAMIGFAISLIGVLGQTAYIWLGSEALNLMGTAAIVMPLLAILISVIMLGVAKMGIMRGWLR